LNKGQEERVPFFFYPSQLGVTFALIEGDQEERERERERRRRRRVKEV
jgi:hypothetical protein